MAGFRAPPIYPGSQTTRRTAPSPYSRAGTFAGGAATGAGVAWLSQPAFEFELDGKKVGVSNMMLILGLAVLVLLFLGGRRRKNAPKSNPLPLLIPIIGALGSLIGFGALAYFNNEANEEQARHNRAIEQAMTEQQGPSNNARVITVQQAYPALIIIGLAILFIMFVRKG